MRPTITRKYVRTDEVPVSAAVEQKRRECIKIKADIRELQDLLMEAEGMHLEAWINRVLGDVPSGFDFKLIESVNGYLFEIDQAISSLVVTLHTVANRPILFHVYDVFEIYETYYDEEKGMPRTCNKGLVRIERQEVRNHCLPGF